MSDLHADYRTLFYTTIDQFDFDRANATLDALQAKCRTFVEGPGAGAIDHAIDFFAEARYRDQIWEIDLPLRVTRFKNLEDLARVREDFDRYHEEVFAFRDPGSDVQFVGWRATVRCRLRRKTLGKLRREKAYGAKVPSSRRAYFNGRWVEKTRVELLEAMKPGHPLKGPAIVESAFTTVVIEPGAEVVRQRSGSLMITP
jgi:N-methylhydantoinase A